jgi:hypothetical protein
VRKARRAGTLYGGGEPSRSVRETLRSHEGLFVRTGWRKGERGTERGRKSLSVGRMEGDAREVVRLKRATRSRSDLNHRGAMRGRASLERASRWNAGTRSMRSRGRASERREGFERVLRSLERIKALKGETLERWGLKEAPQGGNGSHRREGSQTLRAGLPRGRATLLGRASAGA